MNDKNETNINNVSVELSVRVGKVKLKVGDIRNLKEHSVLSLDTQNEEGFELMAGDQVLALGEVTEVDGKLTYTITELLEQ